EFVRAYESADLDAIVALLTDDVFVSMPPMPLEYEGRDVVARFCAGILRPGRRFDLVPTRANGQPAFGTYLRGPTGIRHGTGMFVLTLTGDRICAMTRFENSVYPWFGLPHSLPPPLAQSPCRPMPDLPICTAAQSPTSAMTRSASGCWRSPTIVVPPASRHGSSRSAIRSLGPTSAISSTSSSGTAAVASCFFPSR